MKRIIILASIVVLVVAAWSVAWFWGAGQARGYIERLATADGETTPRVVCGDLAIGGFPFGFDVTCTDATIDFADTTVTVSGLKVSAEVYNPTHVLVFAQSPATVTDAFTGSRSRLDFASASASARLEGWRIGRVSLVVEQPVWNDAVLDDRLIAQAGHFEAHLIDVPEQHDAEAGLAGLAEYAEIDDLEAPGFGIAAGHATFEGEISKLPDDVRSYGDRLLQRWAAVGGTQQIVGFKGDSADGRFDVTGTLGLDDQGRAQGQLRLTSTGVVERFEQVIPNEVKGLVIGNRADDGSYSQTLNLNAGVVFAGLLPAAVIPPLF